MTPEQEGWLRLYRLCGWAICKLTRRHLRGKQTGIDILCPDGATKRTYLCDRCGTTWSRKIKAKEKTA